MPKAPQGKNDRRNKRWKEIEKETDVKMILWVPAQTYIAMRFSLIFEFNESNAIGIYDKYLSEIVENKIPKMAK